MMYQVVFAFVSVSNAVMARNPFVLYRKMIKYSCGKLFFSDRPGSLSDAKQRTMIHDSMIVCGEMVKLKLMNETNDY